MSVHDLETDLSLPKCLICHRKLMNDQVNPLTCHACYTLLNREAVVDALSVKIQDYKSINIACIRLETKFKYGILWKIM